MVLIMSLKGKVALVAGATRGAGRAIAVELAKSGAYVYATGRSSRKSGPSEIGRQETIEETGDMLVHAGGSGSALRVDHLDFKAVDELIQRIRNEKGRLDILVNDIFGGDRYAEWNKGLWKHDLENGMRMLRMGVDTHIITSAKAIPLMLETGNGIVVEMTDGTSEFNRNYRADVGFYYDFVKASVERIMKGLAFEFQKETCTSVAVTPGWLRSEMMLDHFGVTEQNWREGTKKDPHFCISESPYFVARGLSSLCADPEKNGFNGQVLSSHDLSMSYGTTDLDGTKPDCWRYLDEVQEKGLPADDTGYR